MTGDPKSFLMPTAIKRNWEIILESKCVNNYFLNDFS